MNNIEIKNLVIIWVIRLLFKILFKNIFLTKKEMIEAFLKSNIPWRRCPFIRQKIQVHKVLRVSTVIQNRIQKPQKDYFMKALEIFLNTEITNISFLKSFEEIYLFTEIIDFFLYQDDLKKIKDAKYQIKIIICIFQIFLKRVFIPFLINFLISHMNE